jgi:NAD(P)-dependent dehydrogenase (short-subunit alcohol dehydrogenase family)
MKLKGRVALVTGAGRGIGLAHAIRLAKLGADVAINDIDLESFKEFDEDLGADSVVDLISDLGVRSAGFEANVCNEDEAKGMVDQVVSEFGKIDILINNAGGIAGKPAESFASSVSFEDIKNTMDRNLMGTIYCSQAAAVHMKEQESGRIVNTSSQAGMRSQGNGVYASYGVAKAGVIAYTVYLAQELGRYNITVNCLAPAYVATERLLRQSFNRVQDVRKELKVPLGRLAEPDDVAKVMEFFVTDLGDYITGQTISICGGAINFQ